MTALIVVGVILLLALSWVIATYNNLVNLRNFVKESWSGIDTELKRRYDLIPNLVKTVQGYAQHERETLHLLVEARDRAVASTGSPASQAKDENALDVQVARVERSALARKLDKRVLADRR